MSFVAECASFGAEILERPVEQLHATELMRLPTSYGWSDDVDRDDAERPGG
jgi:hypothetical protein